MELLHILSLLHILWAVVMIFFRTLLIRILLLPHKSWILCRNGKETFSWLNYTLECNYALLCFSNVEVINQVKWKYVSEITHLLQQMARLIGVQGRDQADKMTFNFLLKTDLLRNVPEQWGGKLSFSSVCLGGTLERRLSSVCTGGTAYFSWGIGGREKVFWKRTASILEMPCLWLCECRMEWTSYDLNFCRTENPKLWESDAACQVFSKFLCGYLSLKSALVINWDI